MSERSCARGREMRDDCTRVLTARAADERRRDSRTTEVEAPAERRSSGRQLTGTRAIQSPISGRDGQRRVQTTRVQRMIVLEIAGTTTQAWQSPIQAVTPSCRIVLRTGSEGQSARCRIGWPRTSVGLRRRAGVDEVLQRDGAVLRIQRAPQGCGRTDCCWTVRSCQLWLSVRPP